jgi:hypothetical protein
VPSGPKAGQAARRSEGTVPVPAGTRRYAGTFQGDCHYPHSSPEWRPEEASRVIEVRENRANAADALVTIITGHGAAA